MAQCKILRAVQFAIVKMLACYQTPSEVAQAVKEEFGLETSRQSVSHYDPNHSEKLAPHLKTYFEEQRHKFREQLDNLPIESRAHRQRDRLRLWYENETNPKLALSILDSAAREAGGHYTNKGERSPTKRVKTVTVTPQVIESASHEELREILQRLMDFYSEPESLDG